MMNGLTKDDLIILCKPFQPRDHEFLRGYVYLTEEAITARMEELDPAWSFEINTPVYRGESVSIIGRLTIKGVTRSNVGTQSIQYLTDYDKVKKTKTYKLDALTGERMETGEPEKGATTDALKRCARLFGIGRYLLDIPKDEDGKSTVTDQTSLTKWLMTFAKPAQQATSESVAPALSPKQQITETVRDMGESPTYTSKPAQQQPPAESHTGEPEYQSPIGNPRPLKYDIGKVIHDVQFMHKDLVHAQNTVKKLVKDGIIQNNYTDTTAKSFVFKHRVEEDFKLNMLHDVPRILSAACEDAMDSTTLSKWVESGRTLEAAWEAVKAHVEFSKQPQPPAQVKGGTVFKKPAAPAPVVEVDENGEPVIDELTKYFGPKTDAQPEPERVMDMPF